MAGRALAIAGPAGAGKSETAAQMMVAGAGLVIDDLTILSTVTGDVIASAPPAAVPGLELRGIGIVPVSLAPPAPLGGILWLAHAEGPRFPEPEFLNVGGVSVPMLRHPASAGLAAKMLVWIMSRDMAEK